LATPTAPSLTPSTTRLRSLRTRMEVSMPDRPFCQVPTDKYPSRSPDPHHPVVCRRRGVLRPAGQGLPCQEPPEHSRLFPRLPRERVCTGYRPLRL
jgi:hypothetical protein